MKKIFRLFAAFAATTLAFSCMEEANPETGVQNGGSQYDGPMTTIEFALADLETKTAWDGENHTWSDGDQVKIIWGTEDNANVTAEVVDGTVSATVGVADTYYAVYPATTEYVLTEEDQFSVTIPKTQDGTFASANIMAAKTTAAEKTLAFKNLTHIFKFTLSEGCEYNCFRFRSNSTGDDVRMAATPSLITFGDDVTVGIPASGTGNSGYAIVKLEKDAKGPFYLGIRAGADLEGGFGVLASKTGKEGNFTGGLLTTTTVQTTRSQITNLGVLDNNISDDWYITATGKGSGKSWADAAGIELLVKLMKNKASDGTTYSGNGTTDIYRLIDAKIHVAAGTYDIHTANGGANMGVAGLAYDASDRFKSTKITIIGGYPAEPTEGAEPVIGENGSETVFTTNVAGGSNPRAFYFNGSTIGYLVFEGISFKTSGVNAVGNVYFANNVKGQATFNNCYFSVQSTNNNDGAALRVTAGSLCTIELNNCKFVGNSGTKGGAFSKSNTAATVTFNECDFTSNTATADGGALYLDGAKNLTFNECNFTENNSGSENGGGAAYISTDGADVKFENCDFKGNDGSYGGSIFIKTAAKATFVGCSFDSHDTGKGGAISNEVATLIVDGCSFTNNYATNHGGAIVTYGENLSSNATLGGIANTYIYNSLFDNNDVSSSNQGGSIKAHGNGNIVIVNSTFRNSDASTGILRLRSQVAGSTKGWVVGCTFSENNKISIYNQDSDMWVYNTIMNDTNSYYANNATGNGTFGDVVFLKDNYYYSPGGEVKGAKAYLTSLNDKTQLDASVVGTFNATKGVYPVTGVALTNGMSATELSALATDITAAMPLFDATKLTVDQKGNSREDKTVMGAYVGE